MIEACIFDLDGVIVDTAKFHFEAWNKLARKLGFEISLEQNENLKGIGRMESLEYILSIGGVYLNTDEKLKIAAVKNSWYVDLVSNMQQSDLLPGVLNLFRELKSANIKIGLGSASKNARRILHSTNIYDYFDVIIDGTDTTKSKPDPQVFLLGAKKLGIDPDKIVVFEDAKKGLEAAIAGGFKTIGVGEENTLSAADKVIAGLEKIDLKVINDTFQNSVVN